MGNRTAAGLAAIFEDRWQRLSGEDRAQLVEDLQSIQRRDTMIRRARRRWGLEGEKAEELADHQLEPGYCALSRKALARLLPRLESGMSLAEATRQVYPDHNEAREPVDRLPRVEEALPHIRNPVVSRVITELRKIVNALVAQHGRPSLIRVELARDLKASRIEKRRIIERNRSNEGMRQDARTRILDHTTIQEPTRHDVLKVQLAEECNWECPYTGRQMCVATLVGSQSQFDVEHIVPFGRSFDNSFVNKTLCFAPENRVRKRDQTPFEAYGGDAADFKVILDRVRRFQGRLRLEKLRRFRLKSAEDLEDFKSRQLNDTRFASTEAVGYLGHLYGGVIDEGGRRRVQATRGAVSWILRGAWNLNAVLGGNGRKNREDHRHHAVDAVVVALTTPHVIQQISALSKNRQPGARLTFSALDLPWATFDDDVRIAIDQVVVSHRTSRKTSGALHQETLYSPPKQGPDGSQYLHVRRPVHQLGSRAGDIVDPAVRHAVEQKLIEIGGDARRLQGEGNLPLIEAGDGRRIPVRGVRIRVPKTAVKIGAGRTERHVLTGGNHHIEILAQVDESGSDTKWIGRMVTLMDVAGRLRRRLPVVDRSHPDGWEFRFSLAQNDTVELPTSTGDLAMWRVQKMSQDASGYIKIVLQGCRDARRVTDIGERGRTWSPETLRRDGCRKVSVTPIGQVRRSGE